MSNLITKPIPAISIRQPWVDAILYLGKRIENRSRRFNYQGPLILHAAKTVEGTPEDFFFDDGIERPANFPEETITGAALGITLLKDCVSLEEVKENYWAYGPQCLLLGDVIPFEEPIPMQGRLKLFYPQLRDEEHAMIKELAERLLRNA